MDRYYVFPRDGEWVARKGDEDAGEMGSYPDRGAALEACRDDRGDVREDMYVKRDGDFERVGVLVKHRGPEALWLLREDGSVYGEVDHELAPGGGTPIIVNIKPAGEASNAGEVA